jgi:hypothetical protein
MFFVLLFDRAAGCPSTGAALVFHTWVGPIVSIIRKACGRDWDACFAERWTG